MKRERRRRTRAAQSAIRVDRRASHRERARRCSSTIRPSTRRPRCRCASTRVWLRADCDFLTEKARFSYSTDGTTVDAVRPAVHDGVSVEDVPGRALRALSLQHRRRARRRRRLRPDARRRAASARIDAADSRRPHDHAHGRGTRHAVRRRRAGAIHRRRSRARSRRAARGTKYVSVAIDVGQHEHRLASRGRAAATARRFSGWKRCTATRCSCRSSTHRYLRLEPDGRLTATASAPSPTRTTAPRFNWRVGAERTLRKQS